MIIQQALQQYVIGNFDRVVRHPEPERTLNVILDPKSSAVRAGPSTCFFLRPKVTPVPPPLMNGALNFIAPTIIGWRGGRGQLRERTAAFWSEGGVEL